MFDVPVLVRVVRVALDQTRRVVSSVRDVRHVDAVQNDDGQDD